MRWNALWPALVLLLGPPPAGAADAHGASIASPVNIHVAITASDLDWSVFTSPPWTGKTTLHLWNVPLIRESRGMQFAFEGSLVVLDLIPRPGVLNTGTVLQPVLEYSQCLGLEIVADIVVQDASGAGGTLFFRPSDGEQINCSRQCEDLQYRSHFFHGFSSDGTAPVERWDELSGCLPIPVSVDADTWGRTKARYR